MEISEDKLKLSMHYKKMKPARRWPVTEGCRQLICRKQETKGGWKKYKGEE